MSLLKTTRLTQQENKFEIEIPHECLKELGWKKGYILQVEIKDSKAIIKKMSGFVGI